MRNNSGDGSTRLRVFIFTSVSLGTSVEQLRAATSGSWRSAPSIQLFSPQLQLLPVRLHVHQHLHHFRNLRTNRGFDLPAEDVRLFQRKPGIRLRVNVHEKSEPRRSAVQ